MHAWNFILRILYIFGVHLTMKSMDVMWNYSITKPNNSFWKAVRSKLVWVGRKHACICKVKYSNLGSVSGTKGQVIIYTQGQGRRENGWVAKKIMT